MKNADLIFVYGTLRNDAAHEMHSVLRDNAEYLGAASVRGALFDLGTYPGLAIDRVYYDIVRGQLYRLRPDTSTKTLETLDEYEGCAPTSPQPQEYERVCIPVQRDGGDCVDAWAYILKRSVDGLQRIESAEYRWRAPQEPPRVVAEQPRREPEQDG